MKHHLKQVLKGKEGYYIKTIGYYDRAIGKSVALARLSVKYDIPVAVPTCTWKEVLEKDIPKYLPKYFKKKLPKTIVINESQRGRRYKILLVEECLTEEQMNCVHHVTYGKFVGYKNISMKKEK
jgi:hypothetical protein